LRRFNFVIVRPSFSALQRAEIAEIVLLIFFALFL